ncbi:MAG: hypothetical protein SCARUB_03201 [Candidatus Scalindua rubra]|uniref:Uncharacterized protein n=1 Tax=Candidatus Scalindua rubra TaxID=1872076 RepID=A0A1E3X9P1_9BACT|nr:MAG: hypothetical protein SCARUB_03201 [Candidatus Scalindua rubra]
MTENETGKVVVGLYFSHEVTKNTKGKNYYLLFYFFKFRFLSGLCVFV